MRDYLLLGRRHNFLFFDMQRETAAVTVETSILAHDSSKTSGGVYEVGTGWVAKVCRQRSGGKGEYLNEGK